MRSVTSQGIRTLGSAAERSSWEWLAYTIPTGNPRIAEAAAREVRRLGLADALDLALLYRAEPERYERAAARWIARLIEERPGLHLSEIELAAAGLLWHGMSHEGGRNAHVRLFFRSYRA